MHTSSRLLNTATVFATKSSSCIGISAGRHGRFLLLAALASDQKLPCAADVCCPGTGW